MKHKIVELFIYLSFFLVGGIVIFYGNWVGIFFIFFSIWPIIKTKILARILAKIKKTRSKWAIRSSSFWFDGFLFIGSPPLREIRRFAALSRSLDIIYNYFGSFGIEPKYIKQDWWVHLTNLDLINRIIKQWTDFWMQMPIAEDVRERLNIVSNEIFEFIKKSDKNEIKILSLAGGSNQDILMAVSRLQKERDGIQKKVFLVTVEPDGVFGIRRFRELQKLFKIDQNFFSYQEIRKKISLESKKGKRITDILKTENIDINSFDIISCIGLGDYIFGKDKLKTFFSLLDHEAKLTLVANVSDNYIERFFLHILIQWPYMQYLNFQTFWNLVRDVFNKKSVSIIATKNGIFNVAIIKK